jgi:hypothetical protein
MGMTDAVAAEKQWNVLAKALAEEGWCCNYIRIDTGRDTVFVLDGHRAGSQHIVISDELASALLELRLQTINFSPLAPVVVSPLPLSFSFRE